MTATTVEDGLSAECAVGRMKGYKSLHKDCKQLRDIPLPHSGGILLVPRCPCACHRRR